MRCLKLILIIVCVGILPALFFWAGIEYKINSASHTALQLPKTSLVEDPIQVRATNVSATPEGEKYINNKYGFQITVPKDYVIKESTGNPTYWPYVYFRSLNTQEYSDVAAQECEREGYNWPCAKKIVPDFDILFAASEQFIDYGYYPNPRAVTINGVAWQEIVVSDFFAKPVYVFDMRDDSNNYYDFVGPNEDILKSALQSFSLIRAQ